MWLKDLFNKVLIEGKMPDVWRKWLVVSILKGKGDIQHCTNYMDIKFMKIVLGFEKRLFISVLI